MLSSALSAARPILLPHAWRGGAFFQGLSLCRGHLRRGQKAAPQYYHDFMRLPAMRQPSAIALSFAQTISS
jgi:hypothetical protein